MGSLGYAQKSAHLAMSLNYLHQQDRGVSPLCSQDVSVMCCCLFVRLLPTPFACWIPYSGFSQTLKHRVHISLSVFIILILMHLILTMSCF